MLDTWSRAVLKNGGLGGMGRVVVAGGGPQIMPIGSSPSQEVPG